MRARSKKATGSKGSRRHTTDERLAASGRFVDLAKPSDATPLEQVRGAPAKGQDVLLWKIDEAARILNVSRSTIYELASTGQLQLVKILRATRVTDDSIRRFIAKLVEESAGGPRRR
jgi:excisionase family DNA binding protein